MEFIFNSLGWIFGYILWFAFYLFKNFGIAIIIFTIIIKLLLFPFSIIQQKSMASNARFQQKQREIMDKYKNDKVKANEEVQKLMEKENVSPTAGCLPMMAPMFVMLGVWYAVRNPLTNVFHIAADKVDTALQSISTIPGIGMSINSNYGQISVIKYFKYLQDFFVDPSGNPLFTERETASLNEFSDGFNFLGLDLLATPSTSPFSSMMWIIPVLCFITYVLSMLITQKMNGTKMQGCMIAMVFGMPLFSAYISYSVPGAVGFYWIASTVFGFAQSLILNMFYSPSIMEAKAEAQRVVLRRQQEAEYEYIDIPDYQAPSLLGSTDEAVKEKQNKSGNSKKKSNRSSDNKSSYQGRKK